MRATGAPTAARILCLVCVSASLSSLAGPGGVQNLTGLPLYPSLSKASMDVLTRTDTLGRWCSRLVAETSYPLGAVEAWYRKAMVGASETDLANDARYKTYARLSGIKLAAGIDYVTVYRAESQSTTSIELFRCSSRQ